MSHHPEDDDVFTIPFSPEHARRIEKLGFKRKDVKGHVYHFDVLLNAWEETEIGLNIELTMWNGNSALAVGTNDDGEEIFSLQGPPDFVIEKLEPIIPKLIQKQNQQHAKNLEKWSRNDEEPPPPNQRFDMSENTGKQFQIDTELKKRLAGLYQSMSHRLGIQAAPKIVFSHDAANAEEPFGKTAYYDPSSRTIRVYTTKRHPTDMLRSFAHELIHHWQNEHGSLPQSNAGQAHYAQKDPVLRKREMEAYLLGNILFRDWQDENRYGKLNENLEIANPTTVQSAIKRLLFDLIKSNAIRAYHHPATPGDVRPGDYVDEIARKLELELNKFLQSVNNRGNLKTQQIVMKETISKSDLKNLIRERIVEMFEGGGRKRKRKNQGLVSLKSDDESYADWSKKFSKPKSPTYNQWLSDFLNQKGEDDHKTTQNYPHRYYTIGFLGQDNHICWYWDQAAQRLVTAKGGSHEKNFGKVAPYKTYRGRYDMKTKELSLTLPEVGSRTTKVTRDVEKDVPPELLQALKETFPGHKLFYFPQMV